jgi:hypothetical protein
MKSSLRRFSVLWLAILVLAGIAAPASAQVLVYKLRFESERSVNLDFYNEGYFVVPSAGGAGSFIFMVNTPREKSYSPTTPGRLFPALTKDDSLKWIVSATSGGTGGTTTSTSGSSYVCFGSVNQWVRLTGPTFDVRTRISPSLRGSVNAFADESATGPARDGTMSFAAVLDFRMSYDKDRTSSANKKGQTVAKVIEALILELERRGFDAEVTAAPTTTPTLTP